MAQDRDKLRQTKKIFRERLQQGLRDRGVEATARSLSALIDVGDREASRYLNGERIPTGIIMGRLEQALGTSPGWLVGLDGPENTRGAHQDERSGGGANRVAPKERRAGMTGLAVVGGDEMSRQAEAQLVSDALGRVVGKHEVVGLDLRRVLMRMAAGLDALNHQDAAGEIYSLLVKLNDLDLGRGKP